MSGEVLLARGGQLGGAGTPTGERVVVRLEDGVVDVFDETNSFRYHAELIDAIELKPSEAPTGENFHVAAARQGFSIPVRFEGSERAALERIIESVRAARR